MPGGEHSRHEKKKVGIDQAKLFPVMDFFSPTRSKSDEAASFTLGHHIP